MDGTSLAIPLAVGSDSSPTAGSAISQGSQIGLGMFFLKYGREYERQADLMGAQIMARAGYDPRESFNESFNRTTR